MKISIIIPTLNEVKNVPLVVNLVSAAKEKKDFAYEVIFVDDKSTDGTQEAIKALSVANEDIRLVVSEQRMGLGHALKQGILAANGDLILFLDCDVSIDSDDLVKLVSGCSLEEMVIGSRYTNGGRTIGAPVVKVFLSKWLNIFISYYLGISAIDISHSLRIFPKGRFELPKNNSHPAFFWELSLIANLKGVRVTEVPITFRERIAGVSKNTTKKMIASVMRGLRTVVELKQRNR